MVTNQKIVLKMTSLHQKLRQTDNENIDGKR